MAIELTAASNQEIEILDSPNLSGLSALSISFWVNSSMASGVGHFIAKYATNNREWIIQVSLDSPEGEEQLLFYVYDEDNNGYIGCFKNNPSGIFDGNLHHIVATWDGGTTFASQKLYKDGVEFDDDGANVGTFVQCRDGSSDVNIGSLDGSSYFLTGIVSDLRIYNRELSLAEIQHIYYSQGADNTVNSRQGHWRMDEGVNGAIASGANSIIDISGNSNHGTATNSPVYVGGTVRYINPIIF